MHDKMRVRQALVNLLDTVHGQDLSVGFARELVRAMTCPDRDGQSIHPGLRNEVLRLVGIRKKLIKAQFSRSAVTVFLLTLATFERSQAT